MKPSMFICGLLVATLIVGCQDSSITDPITPAVVKDVQLSKDQPVNSLALRAILHELGNVYNSFLQVAGAAAYQTTIVPLDPIPPNPQYAIRLNLIVNAELRPYHQSVPPMLPVWHVSGTSDDWVPIPASGEAFLEKRCRIEGRSDGMLLNVRFRITLTSVELNSMWLELPRVVRAEDHN